jgi:hypothetical protein
MAFVDYCQPATGRNMALDLMVEWTAPEGWERHWEPARWFQTYFRTDTGTPEPVFTPPPTMPEPNGFFPGH